MSITNRTLDKLSHESFILPKNSRPSMNLGAALEMANQADITVSITVSDENVFGKYRVTTGKVGETSDYLARAVTMAILRHEEIIDVEIPF